MGNNSDKGQKKDTIEVGGNTYKYNAYQPTEIDILASYYQQDGNNGAVTGGIGTEFLTDYTTKIIAKVPLNQKLSLNIDGGFDYYSSASTDNIDNIQSSDSASDMRGHANAGFTYKIDDQQTFGARIGASAEYDYYSGTAGFDYGWSSKNKNTTIGLSGQAFIDQWVLIYPIELRGQGQLVPTKNRQSYNGSLTLSQVLNKRMQISLQAEAIYMNGLLSTPFHRVYFQEQDLAKVEQLPSTRLKIPIGLRFNYFVTENLLARLSYRYYQDDWGVQGHTASIELPVKLNRFLSVYPFYRYHMQTGADYFKPYKQHTLNQEFYTSDFDLAELTSQTYGLGLRYSPVNGLGSTKIPFSKRKMLVKSFDIKYSHYRRSTGLNSNIISLGVSFSF